MIAIKRAVESVLTEEAQERQSNGTKLVPLGKSNKGRILQEQQLDHNNSVVYSCRYCDNFETDIKEEYESQVVLKHKQVNYAIPRRQTWIYIMGIQGQGKVWGS